MFIAIFQLPLGSHTNNPVNLISIFDISKNTAVNSRIILEPINTMISDAFFKLTEYEHNKGLFFLTHLFFIAYNVVHILLVTICILTQII